MMNISKVENDALQKLEERIYEIEKKLANIKK